MRGARALAPERRFSASPGTGATGFSSEKPCGGVAQRPRGRCGAARPAATWPFPAPSLHGLAFSRRSASSPSSRNRKKGKIGLGTRLNCARLRVGCVRGFRALAPGRPSTRAAAPGVRARSRPRAGPSGAGGAPGEFQLRPRPAGGGEGAARVASRTLNL